MPNSSIDGFSVLSPSQKKELERQRQEKEAQEAARKAEEERKSQEAARKAEEEAAKRRAEAERKAAAAKKAREAKKRKGSIISLLVCLSLTALMVGLFYILHVYDLDVLNLLYVPLAIFLGLPIVWGGIYGEIKDNF